MKISAMEWARICALTDDQLLAELFEGMSNDEIAAYCAQEVQS